MMETRGSQLLTYVAPNLVTFLSVAGFLVLILSIRIWSKRVVLRKYNMDNEALMVKPPLTARERLDMLPALLSCTASGARSTLTGLHRKDKHARTHGLHVRYAIMRKAITRMTPKQLRHILPATNKIYESYMKKKGKKPDTVELGEGALGHWIGDKNAQNVLLYFHGGGYALPALEGYFQFYEKLIKNMRNAGKSVCVFALTYTLAPDASYPTQIRQAAACLQYILDQGRWNNENIFLGGDSAGGNLVCALISHLAHPHPKVQALSVTSELGGILLLSPWTYLQSDMQGHVIDASGDLVSEKVGDVWSSAYLGGAPNDNYTDASTAPGEWFAAFPVRKIFVSAGSNEILLPAIEMLVENLRSGYPGQVDFVVGRREAHVAPIYDPFLGCKKESEQAKGLETWLKNSLV